MPSLKRQRQVKMLFSSTIYVAVKEAAID